MHISKLFLSVADKILEGHSKVEKNIFLKIIVIIVPTNGFRIGIGAK